MEFDSEILMNSTSEGETTEGGTADEEGEGGDYAIHRRSSWGDLWN